jgi:hypothetical protein
MPKTKDDDFKIIDINKIPKQKRKSKWKTKFDTIPPNKALEISNLREAYRALMSLNAFHRKGKYLHLKSKMINKKTYIMYKQKKQNNK